MGVITDAMDKLQLSLKCCGANSTEDWKETWWYNRHPYMVIIPCFHAHIWRRSHFHSRIPELPIIWYIIMETLLFFQVPWSCCEDWDKFDEECPIDQARGIGCAGTFLQLINERMAIIYVGIVGVILLQILLAVCGCALTKKFANKVEPF